MGRPECEDYHRESMHSEAKQKISGEGGGAGWWWWYWLVVVLVGGATGWWGGWLVVRFDNW